jgi:GABA(A) receptor-associated protein
MAYEYQFKKENPDYTKRLMESSKIRDKYPDRIPVICEKNPKSKIGNIDKTKYLVPADLTITQFSCIIRKKLELEKSKALFLLISGKHAPTGESIMSDIYAHNKDQEDGFLYITYTGEETWG